MSKDFLNFHLSFFILLVLTSFFSFFLIFSTAFNGSLNYIVFLIVGVIAAIWSISYVSKISLKRKFFQVVLIISGAAIMYNIFLSTLFLDPRAIQSGWIFIGTPLIMFIVWLFLIYKASRKNVSMHWLLWVLFFGIVFFYAWHITAFYYTNVIL